MYNRYIPQTAAYAPVSPPSPAPRWTAPNEAGGGSGGLNGLLRGMIQRAKGGEGSGVSHALSSALKSVGLKELDAGDILLALIVLLLILEDGDDLDVLITLGLMILLNLGES